MLKQKAFERLFLVIYYGKFAAFDILLNQIEYFDLKLREKHMSYMFSMECVISVSKENAK